MIKFKLYLGIFSYLFIYLFLTLSIYLISVYTNYNGLGVPLFNGKDDGVFYYEQAMNIVNGLPVIENPQMHVILIGWLMKITNIENPIIIRVYNFFGTMLILLISLLVLKKLTSNTKELYLSGVFLCVILSLYPSLVVYNVLSINRDVWIILFFLLSIYLFINIFIKKGKYPIIVSILCILPSIYFLGEHRHYALLSYLLGSVAFLLLNVAKNYITNGVKFFISFGIVCFSLFFILFKNITIPIVGMSFMDALAYRNLAFEGMGGVSQMNISLSHPSLILFYSNYFYSIVSNTVGPFPWQVTGFSSLILLLTEGIFFSFVFFFLYKQRKNFNKVEQYLVIQSVIWFMLISVTNDNFGTGSRLRILGWIPILIIFSKYIAIYILKKREKIVG